MPLPPKHSHDDRDVTILLVDDDPDIREIVSLALTLDSRLHLLEADRGSAALDLMQNALIPDVILIDNRLPDMDGLELMALIHRLHPATVKRIAFFTASVRSEEISRFQAAGAIGVIQKPFNPLDLPSVLRSLIEPHQGG